MNKELIVAALKSCQVEMDGTRFKRQVFDAVKVKRALDAATQTAPVAQPRMKSVEDAAANTSLRMKRYDQLAGPAVQSAVPIGYLSIATDRAFWMGQAEQAEHHLKNLTDALNNAYISAWQTTPWKPQLDAATQYLKELP